MYSSNTLQNSIVRVNGSQCQVSCRPSKHASMLQSSWRCSAISCPVAAIGKCCKLGRRVRCSVSIAMGRRGSQHAVLWCKPYRAAHGSVSFVKTPPSAPSSAAYCCAPSLAELKFIARCKLLVQLLLLPNAAFAARATFFSSSEFCHSTGSNISSAVVAPGADGNM